MKGGQHRLQLLIPLNDPANW